MFFERMSYVMADFVITANATFKDIAISRAVARRPSKVEVVYGVPDRKRIYRVEPEPGLHGGRKFVGYLGIINEQDGVDHLRAVAHLVKVKAISRFSRSRCRLWPGARIGARPRLFARSCRFCSVLRYLNGGSASAHISAFDIGVIPDPLEMRLTTS